MIRLKMAEEYGYGGAFSMVMIMIVVAALFLTPFVMGPLGPPPFYLLVIFPIILVAIFVYLTHASK